MAQTSSAGRPTYSCTRCAGRKVKCDRQRPCSACLKHNVGCIYNPGSPSQPPRRKRVKVKTLTDRLRHYEALLHERGIEPSEPTIVPKPALKPTQESTPNKSQSQDGFSIEDKAEQDIDSIDPAHDRGRFHFIENSLWQRVIQESHESDDTLDDQPLSSEQDASDNESSFVRTSSRMKAKPQHPAPDHIIQLWDIFVESVDPLTKVVHVPTLRPAVQKVISNIARVPRTLEALMFAIYSVAVMSLKDDQCKQRFSEPRSILLARWVKGTEIVLSRAKFMETTSLVTLQALLLHLLSVREIYEPRAVWTLTGVAIRIAQAMGLDQDGASLGLSSFETEIRRRVWWQLKLNDNRTAELCGLAKFRDLVAGTETTAWPTNLNDDQLYPKMSTPVAEAKGLTDVAFVALRCELAKFALGRIAKLRKEGMTPAQWSLDTPSSGAGGVEEACAELEETLEMNYLRYCDPSQPLHLVVMLVARYGLNTVRFMTNHPRRWVSLEQTPLSERQLVWDICIKLLEQYSMILTTPLIERFVWHATYFQHWHALIHVLDTLRADPAIADAMRAWRLIEITYENVPNMIMDLEKPIHLAVCNLCLKAYSAREAAAQNKSTYNTSFPLPVFIVQLRQQREALWAKREARRVRGSRSMNSTNHGTAHGNNLDPAHNPGMDHSNIRSETSFLQQSATLHAPSPNEVGDADASLHPALFNGFEDSVVNGFDVRLDQLLASTWNMDVDAMEATSWEQWDSWLAESNTMRP